MAAGVQRAWSDGGVVEARAALAELSRERAYVSVCCTGCGATRKLKRCARCKVACFCGAECVQRAWVEHKPHCTRWEAQASAGDADELVSQ